MTRREALISEFQSNSEQFRRQFAGTNDIETEMRNRQAERVSAEIERRKSNKPRENFTDGIITGTVVRTADKGRNAERGNSEIKINTQKPRKRNHEFDR